MIFYFPQEGSAKSKDSQSMDASHYHHSVLLLDTIIQTTTATTIAATSIRENDSEWWFYRHLVVTTTQAVAATWCGFLLHQFLCFVHMWIVAFPLLLALGKVVFSRKLAHWLAVLVGGWMQWQWTGWIHYCWMMEWNLLAQDNRLYIMVWLTSTNITCFIPLRLRVRGKGGCAVGRCRGSSASWRCWARCRARPRSPRRSDLRTA